MLRTVGKDRSKSLHAAVMKGMPERRLGKKKTPDPFNHRTSVASDFGGMKRQSRECAGQRNNSLRLAVANVLQIIQVAMKDLVPLLGYTPYTSTLASS